MKPNQNHLTNPGVMFFIIPLLFVALRLEGWPDANTLTLILAGGFGFDFLFYKGRMFGKYPVQIGCGLVLISTWLMFQVAFSPATSHLDKGLLACASIGASLILLAAIRDLSNLLRKPENLNTDDN